MIKYDSNFGGSLVVAVIFLLIIASSIAFADDSKKIQTTGFMDFNMSVHSGFGDNYDGIAFGGRRPCRERRAGDGTGAQVDE